MKKRRNAGLYITVGIVLLSLIIWVGVGLVSRGENPVGPIIALIIGGFIGIGFAGVILHLSSRVAPRAAKNAQEYCPNATIIPAFTTREMLDLGYAGVPIRGWTHRGGSGIAVAVFPDRFELWARRGKTPRWVIPRAEVQEMGFAEATLALRTVDSVGMVVGGHRMLFIPAYKPFKALLRSSAPGMEQALQELGGPVGVVGAYGGAPVGPVAGGFGPVGPVGPVGYQPGEYRPTYTAGEYTPTFDAGAPAPPDAYLPESGTPSDSWGGSYPASPPPGV